MSKQISYKDIATIPNYHVEHFINQINILFNVHYHIYAGRGCKWSNARSLESALNDNHYADHFNDVNVDSITAFIKHIDELRRETNTIDTSINSDNSLDMKQRSIYQQAMQLLVKHYPLLKPLPPKTNKQPQRYIDKLIRANNKEISKFIDEHHGEIDNNTNGYLIINYPHDFNAAVSRLRAYARYENTTIRPGKLNGEPIVNYYYNHLRSMDDVYDALDEVFACEIKPFKLNFRISGVFEVSDMFGGYTYTAEQIYWNTSNETKPIIIKTRDDLKLVKEYINSTLIQYKTSSSSKLLSIVETIAFTVSRMLKISGKVKGLPEVFVKSRSIIVDNEDDRLCWYRFVALCLYPELRNTKINNIKTRTQRAKSILLAEHNITYSNHMTQADKKRAAIVLSEFQGMNQFDMKDDAIKRKLNVNIFDYNDKYKRYDCIETWIGDESKQEYHNALIYSDKHNIHIMYIQPDGVESITSIYFCPKCHLYSVRGDNKKAKLNKHIKHCDGKFHAELMLDKVAQPYCPGILKNGIVEYCLAYNIKWYPYHGFITYDFETVENVINNQISASTQLDSTLMPISVASCIHLESGSDTTIHFDARDNEFIPIWLSSLFKHADRMLNEKLEFYSQMLFNKPASDATIKALHKLDSNINSINVYGFNSSRFDSNLFKSYFNHEFNNMHWTVESPIGTGNSLKQFILTTNSTDARLRFVDAQAFIAGGTLKAFAKDFGGADDNKGVFPYEAITTDNFNDVLSMTEPFTHDAFYSSLHRSNLLTDDQYEQYVNDAKHYANRWDYLLHYNDTDVEIMIKSIINLIDMNAEYLIDLQHNLSLSSNSSAIKYMLAYKGFNPNEDYAVTATDATFKPTSKWWIHKCNSYRNQDEAFNNKISKQMKYIDPVCDKYKALKQQLRDLNQCVTSNDYDEFVAMYHRQDHCYLCGEAFTETNTPTLDRINNSIGHSLSNCKLACASCNTLRKRDDDRITRLRIQLAKYCKANNLPTTVTTRSEYQLCRRAIFGGLSIVLHRVNIAGVTHINLNRYDAESKKIINYDTPNIMTHVFGIDFNSLYPSAFSSIPHPFNPYTGHVMWMPGSLIKEYNCITKSDFKQLLHLITDPTVMHADKPPYLFIAEVKLKCSDERINDLINLPPVFRHHEIVNDEAVIGKYMYDYMTSNKIHASKRETKLTCLLDTCNEFMPFSSYYLWLLLDLGLVITDIKCVATYTAHNAFNAFVTDHMQKRVNILSGKSTGNEKFYKISMNGSYGYDGMNTERFMKIKFCDENQARTSIISDSYRGGYKLNDATWFIEKQSKYFNCNTPIQESVFTLDNAKYWYLTFIYKFMYRCLDTNRFHFTSGDTDSIYMSVSGDSSRDSSQGFDAIVKDKEFYSKWIYTFMPDPSINTFEDMKKPLGNCIEKHGQNQIATSPKSYTIFNNDGSTISLKLKGISKTTNHLASNDYSKVIDESTVVKGSNTSLQMHDHVMSKVTTTKNALTGFNNKVITLSNGACVPYIAGLTANDVIIKND